MIDVIIAGIVTIIALIYIFIPFFNIDPGLPISEVVVISLVVLMWTVLLLTKFIDIIDKVGKDFTMIGLSLLIISIIFGITIWKVSK